MKRILIIAPLTLLLLLLAGCMPPGEPEVTEEFVDISDTKRIDIDLSSSNLEIIVEDRNNVHIEYLTYENGPDLRIREGSSLRITEETDWPLAISFNRSPKLNLYVPETFNEELIIETSSGDIGMKDMVLSYLDANLSSGEFYAENLTLEEIKIHLSSGDILIENMTAELIDVHTSSGRTELYDVEGRIKGRASSGNVIIELKHLVGDIDYSLSSGNMELNLPKDSDATLDLSCSSGNVRESLSNLDIDKEDDDLLKGRIGNGRYDIDLHTSSGNITIED